MDPGYERGSSYQATSGHTNLGVLMPATIRAVAGPPTSAIQGSVSAFDASLSPPRIIVAADSRDYHIRTSPARQKPCSTPTHAWTQALASTSRAVHRASATVAQS